jgi:hypothetical protein
MVPLTVTPKTKEALGQASPWLRFIAILGFIGVGVLAVAGVLLMIFGGAIGAAFGHWFIGMLLGLFYLALAVVLFFPTMMMSRLATRSKKYGAAGDPAELEGFAIQSHRLARFYGIFAIVMLAAYLVAVVVIVLIMVLK